MIIRLLLARSAMWLFPAGDKSCVFRAETGTLPTLIPRILNSTLSPPANTSAQEIALQTTFRSYCPSRASVAA